jgi:hypothetical protein
LFIAETISAFRKVVREEIAPMKEALNIVMAEVLDPWDKIQTDSSSVFDQNAPSKPDIHAHYDLQKGDCMLLGTLPDRHYCANILAAHIWPKHTYGKGLETFDLSQNDMSSPRNYLLLQAEIEHLFDRKQFILLPVHVQEGEFALRVVVLYPDLLGKTITIHSRSKLREFEFPFSDLHGRQSDHVFSTNKKPFLRLIAQHAFCAMKKAIRLGAVTEDYCSNLRNETIELARQSLGDVSKILQYNGLESLIYVNDEEEESSSEIDLDNTLV